MQFTPVRIKEKDYDIYLKSEKLLVHSQQEQRKKCFPAIWRQQKWVPSYFEPDKRCCSYLEREKSGSLLFGDQKMQFTTVRSKEKDYDIYLKSEKLFTASRSTKKMFPSYLEKKLVPSYFEPDMLQLFGKRKKWIPVIWRQKMQFTTVRSKKYIMTSI